MRTNSEEKDFRTAPPFMIAYRQVELGGQTIAIQAARNLRTLRELRVTVRKTIDTLIGTACIEYGYDLSHNDRDFDAFEQHLGLRSATVQNL